MKSDLKILAYAFLRFMNLIALVLLGIGMIFIDIFIVKTRVLEASFTEISQELILALITCLFWMSSRQPGQRGIGILVGGFFACMLIRELDGLFDPISYGFWLWPALIMAGTCLFLAFGKKHARRETLSGLAEFSARPSFGLIMSGLAVLVFSRLFGMGFLWHGILHDGYARLAKTTVEEGLELLAYCISLGGTLDYYRNYRCIAAGSKA